jgi:hypothetical protein
MQTAVPYNIGTALTGAKADLVHGYTRSFVNAEASAEIPFGVVVKRGTNDGEAKLVDSATAKLAGLVLHSHAYDVRYELGTTGVKPTVMLSLLQKGTAYVAVEEAVVDGDIPWVRFAAGSFSQLGAFRKSADGAAAEVKTVTPTAVNSTEYVLRVEVLTKNFTFEYLSDSSATATEICAGFRTLMQADAEFNALVTSGGTSTLTLTAAGSAVGTSLTVQSEGDGALAVANTTPAAATAFKLHGCMYRSTQATPGGLAIVEVDFNSYANLVNAGVP